MMLDSLMDPNDVEKVTISKHVVLQSALYSKPQDDSFLKGLQQQQISINRAKTELSSLPDCWLLGLSGMQEKSVQCSGSECKTLSSFCLNGLRRHSATFSCIK